jgi:hypothetical protein
MVGWRWPRVRTSAASDGPTRLSEFRRSSSRSNLFACLFNLDRCYCDAAGLFTARPPASACVLDLVACSQADFLGALQKGDRLGGTPGIHNGIGAAQWAA